jgi:hypothetical protein
MSDGSANPETTSSERSGSARPGVDPAALLQAAAILSIADEATETGGPAADAHRLEPTPSRMTRTHRRVVRSPRRRRPARVAHGVVKPPAAQPTPEPVATQPEPVDTQSELRNWIKDNATLMSNASLLISLAAVALGFLPQVGVIDPYVKALIFGAAIILLIELHHQWPESLRLHTLRSLDLPDEHSWRMAAFAYLMQAATVLFAIWAALTNPLIFGPLTAFAVVFLFRRLYFRKTRGWPAKVAGIVAVVVALLLSELLILLIWAGLTGKTVTLQIWEEDRPGITLDIGDVER